MQYNHPFEFMYLPSPSTSQREMDQTFSRLSVVSTEHKHKRNQNPQRELLQAQTDNRGQQAWRRRFSIKRKTKTTAVNNVMDVEDSGSTNSVSPSFSNFSSSSLHLTLNSTKAHCDEQEAPRMLLQASNHSAPGVTERPQQLLSAMKKGLCDPLLPRVGANSFASTATSSSASRSTAKENVHVTSILQDSCLVSSNPSVSNIPTIGSLTGPHPVTPPADSTQEGHITQEAGPSRPCFLPRQHKDPSQAQGPRHALSTPQQEVDKRASLVGESPTLPVLARSGVAHASFPLQPLVEPMESAVSGVKVQRRDRRGGKRNEARWSVNALEASHNRALLEIRIQALRQQIRQATKVLMHVVHTKSVPSPTALQNLGHSQMRSRQKQQQHQILSKSSESSGCTCAHTHTGEEDGGTDHEGLIFLVACYCSDPEEFQGRVLRQVEAIQHELQFLRQEKLEIERRMTVRVRQYEHERVREDKWIEKNDKLQATFMAFQLNSGNLSGDSILYGLPKERGISANGNKGNDKAEESSCAENEE